MRVQTLLCMFTIVAFLTENAAFSARNAPKQETFICMMDRLNNDLIGLAPDEREAFAEAEGDLWKIPARSAEESKALNDELMKRLEDSPIVSVSKTSRRKGTFSVEEINHLFDRVANNPIVKKTQCGGMTKGGYFKSEEGFCFARAWAVQKEALREIGTNPNVKKLWVMGRLKEDKTEFSYHVATAVRADNGVWYVVDPDFSRPLLLRDWYREVNAWSLDNKMRLFATPGKYHLPNLAAKLTPAKLKSGKPLTEFFVDYLDDFYASVIGKPGPWNRLKTEQARKRVIMRTLQWLGVGTFMGGVYYYHENYPISDLVPPRPRPSPKR